MRLRTGCLVEKLASPSMLKDGPFFALPEKIPAQAALGRATL